MGKLSKLGKRTVAGTTAAAVLVGGGSIGWHFMEERGQAGAHGAVVDLNEENGMLLRDIQGRPAFVNYFNSTRSGQMSLDISISTTHAMPGALNDRLGQLTKFRQEHVSTKVDSQDYRPIDDGSAQVIRDFFREFEELTGIKVNVRENDSNADITIGGYISHDNYIGFASFPQEIPALRHLPQNRGFMMLDVEYLKQKLQEGNVEAVLALISHEFGHNLGLLHPHDGLVHTAMNDKQQDAVARMSYNNHTFPEIAETDIDTGLGPLDIHLVRSALRELGVDVPRIHAGNDTYLLSELAERQREAARAKGGYLMSLPAISLLDNGGRNTLEGTAGRDLLVTEAGYCGLIDRDEKKIRLMKDGQPYCLVEGEFSVVRSGAGDDLILTANGTAQTVYLGTGRNEVAMVHEQLGDKNIVTLPVEDERGPLETFLDVVDEVNPLTEEEAPEQATAETSRLNDDTVTLTMHHSLLRSADAVVHQDGDNIVVGFYASSGRKVGSFNLVGQASENRGINTFRVIDDEGQTMAEYDVTDMRDYTRWQDEVMTPAQQIVEETMMENMRADLARTRQTLAGTAGAWTARGEDPATETKEAPGTDKDDEKHSHGHSHNEKRPVPPNYPDGKEERKHTDAILRRRQMEKNHGVLL